MPCPTSSFEGTIVYGSPPLLLKSIAAVVSGCCAMLFQWGIVYNNDPTLYVSKLQTYLMRGADTREGDVYPNQEWGYGTINMIKVFDRLKANKLFINTAVNPFSE